MGVHILDTARFFFGEAQVIFCQTSTVNKNVKGEDSATIMMRMNDVICLVQISYSSIVENDKFPETFAFIEGEKGSIELCPDYWIRVTTKGETRSMRIPPKSYPWANPDYLVTHSSIVATNAHWLESFRTGREPETSGEDNLKTLQLVYLAYESSKTGKSIDIGSI